MRYSKVNLAAIVEGDLVSLFNNYYTEVNGRALLLSWIALLYP